MLKKILSFLLLVSLIFSINTSVFANESQGITYKEFKKAQDDGYIGKEITYEEWNKIIELNNQLEQKLENDDNFNKIYDSSNPQSKDIPTLEKGDILVTNGTSAFGLTGHAAIAIGESSILHSPGPKEPDGKVVKVDTRSEFYNRYITEPRKEGSNPWIKIFRPINSSYGIKSANWAENTYRYGSPDYKINGNLYSTNETYCSKIVFQAYRFGANTEDAFNYYYDNLNNFHGNAYYLNNTIVSPYELEFIIKSDISSMIR